MIKVKKILIGVGSLTTVLSPVVTVVACSDGKKSGIDDVNSQKKKKKDAIPPKLIQLQRQNAKIEEFLNFISPILPGVLGAENLKSSDVNNLLRKLINNGLEGMESDGLDSFLTNIKASEAVISVVSKIIDLKLIKNIKDGFKDFKDESNSWSEDKIGELIKTLLPQDNEILSGELIKKIILGFDDVAEVKDSIKSILNKLNLDIPSSSNIIRGILAEPKYYENIEIDPAGPLHEVAIIMQKGIVHLTQADYFKLLSKFKQIAGVVEVLGKNKVVQKIIGIFNIVNSSPFIKTTFGNILGFLTDIFKDGASKIDFNAKKDEVALLISIIKMMIDESFFKEVESMKKEYLKDKKELKTIEKNTKDAAAYKLGTKTYIAKEFGEQKLTKEEEIKLLEDEVDKLIKEKLKEDRESNVGNFEKNLKDKLIDSIRPNIDEIFKHIVPLLEFLQHGLSGDNWQEAWNGFIKGLSSLNNLLKFTELDLSIIINGYLI